MVNSSAWLATTKFFIVLGILCPFYVFILFYITEEISKMIWSKTLTLKDF